MSVLSIVSCLLFLLMSSLLVVRPIPGYLYYDNMIPCTENVDTKKGHNHCQIHLMGHLNSAKNNHFREVILALELFTKHSSSYHLLGTERRN